MTDAKAHELSSEELSILNDNENWKYGPTFDIRFYCPSNFDFELFENALWNDDLVVDEKQFGAKTKKTEETGLNKGGNIAFWQPEWPTSAGALYYNYWRENSNSYEPSIVFYPGMVTALVNSDYLNLYKDVDAPTLIFVKPLYELASRLKVATGADRVTLATEDNFGLQVDDGSGVWVDPGVLEHIKTAA